MPVTVLFVCTGNVCRSPAAERLLSGALDPNEVSVSSAGTYALVGEPMQPPMAALVEGHGADPTGFQARQVTAEVVAGADLVLTLTSEHRGAVVDLRPAAVQRTFVLGELAHMVEQVDRRDVDALVGQDAGEGERLRALVALAKSRRTPGVDPDEDVPDPYGRSNAAYARSFDQILRHLAPVVRLVASSPQET